MKKYLFIIAAAATCLLVACSKEKELRAPETNTEETTASEFVRLPGWTYVGASNLEDSKASITNDATPVFKWNAGDKIALFTDNNDYLVSAGLDNSFDNATEAEFAFEGTGIDAHRAFFAVYPASLVSGCANPTANSLAINLPASYTLAQVQSEVSPIPMVAANAPGDPLAFKSICALLRITVKNVAWDAKSIKIRFPGQKVNGSFALSSFVPGESGVAGAASSSEAEETITITDLNLNDTYAEQLVVNIPVPMGTFNYVVTGVYDASDLIINYINTPVKPDGSTGEPLTWSPGRKSRRTLTADLPVFSTVKNGNVDAASRKTLVFAPGNLQAKLATVPSTSAAYSADMFGTASKWQFAPNQYTALGAYKPDGRSHPVNALQDSQVDDWIDLFSWMGNDATNATVIALPESQKYGISYPYNASGGGSWFGTATTGELWFDWGKNLISGYAANAWQTPTGDALENMLVYRKKNNSYTETAIKATITTNGDNPEVVAYGLAIIPDNYSHPYGVPALQNIYNHSRYDKTTCPSPWQSKYNGPVCSDNVFTLAQWEKLEGAGLVFLPLTNNRKYSSSVGKLNVPGDAWYWTSSTNGSNSYALAFNYNTAGTSDLSTDYDNLQAKKSRDRRWGSAVRLVRWVKP